MSLPRTVLDGSRRDAALVIRRTDRSRVSPARTCFVDRPDRAAISARVRRTVRRRSAAAESCCHSAIADGPSARRSSATETLTASLRPLEPELAEVDVDDVEPLPFVRPPAGG